MDVIGDRSFLGPGQQVYYLSVSEWSYPPVCVDLLVTVTLMVVWIAFGLLSLSQ